MQGKIWAGIVAAAVLAVAGISSAGAFAVLNEEWYQEENPNYNVNWMTPNAYYSDAHVYRWCFNTDNPLIWWTDNYVMVVNAFNEWQNAFDGHLGVNVMEFDEASPCPGGYQNPEGPYPWIGCSPWQDDGVFRVSVQSIEDSAGYGPAGIACPMRVNQTTDAAASGRVEDCDLTMQINEFITAYPDRYPVLNNLYKVALHEIGHCVGLDHPSCSVPALMCSGTTNPPNLRDSIQSDDVNGIKWIYRDADNDRCTAAEEAWLVTIHNPQGYTFADTNYHDFMDNNNNGIVNSQDQGLETQAPFPDAAPFDGYKKDNPLNGVINSADVGRQATQFNWKCLKP
jgi:hypothetical protein